MPGTLSDDAVGLSVCLSVVYIRPKSRTEKPRKIKIGVDVAHVTRDSGTTFRGSKGQTKVKVTGAGAYCGGIPLSLFLLF